MSQRETDTTRQRWQVEISGIVQGVGFRPFVYRLARELRVTGWVCNTGDGVLIEAEGVVDDLERLCVRVQAEAPSPGRVDTLRWVAIPALGAGEFDIRESAHGGRMAGFPPDVATCPECLAEITDPTNRRYGYLFTNCTHCGPRFTIIRGLPYDRPATTMAGFSMCPACRAEYDDHGDRRFHAQPNACPVCGPHLSLDDRADLDDVAAIAETARLLRAGRIVAVKGLGGYHLACDACNAAAVRELRARKGRAGKPFALMCPGLVSAAKVYEIDAAAERLLTAPERPIVLLPAREDNGIAPETAPGVHTLGIMLPYTPLHHLLLAEFGGPLVMTSGNLSDEPLAYDDNEARVRLGHLADHFLTHNRPIHVPCDDSVVRAEADGARFIRRARGYVPCAIPIAEEELPPILACGGDLKSTFCLTHSTSALLSPHLGDLENAATLAHYRRMVAHYREFYNVQPAIIAHDLHPDYQSTRFAHEQTGTLVAVQHHHAHIAACMAEHRLQGPVIGVAFDGTGYGTDGTIWGGEFLIADACDFRRAAHLAPVPLPGGEAAIRRPGRLALAWLLQARFPDFRVPGLVEIEVEAVRTQIARRLNAPLTTSMGRLFDAVSALLGICGEVTYEGQAAIELEAAATTAEHTYPYLIERASDGRWIIDPSPIFPALLVERDAGVASAAFHATIAVMTADICVRLREETGLDRVALSGGVFQNRLLDGLVGTELTACGFNVYRHHLVPCNDGGVSLGQALVAARRMCRTCV